MTGQRLPIPDQEPGITPLTNSLFLDLVIEGVDNLLENNQDPKVKEELTRIVELIKDPNLTPETYIANIDSLYIQDTTELTHCMSNNVSTRDQRYISICLPKMRMKRTLLAYNEAPPDITIVVDWNVIQEKENKYKKITSLPQIGIQIDIHEDTVLIYLRQSDDSKTILVTKGDPIILQTLQKDIQRIYNFISKI